MNTEVGNYSLGLPEWTDSKNRKKTHLPSFFSSWISSFLNDPRDLVFIQTALIQFFTLLPCALCAFLIDWPWWGALLYWIYFVYSLGPFLLMLHLTCHRQLFKKNWDWANKLIPWILGPFFGQIPEGFFAHHIGMHHREGNLTPDLSSTLPFQRDSFRDWLNYFTRFVMRGRLDLLVYFWKRKRYKLMKRLALGMIYFYSLIIGLALINFQAALILFIVPTAIAWFGLMAGNWTQHAFVDSTQPDNPYRNSITIVNSLYNIRCFNDGYHIGHHLQPSMHWTEMPDHFANNIQKYIDQKSIVFRTLDYQMIWFLLMAKKYRTLARFFVNLDSRNPLSPDEIEQLLRSRTRKN